MRILVHPGLTNGPGMLRVVTGALAEQGNEVVPWEQHRQSGDPFDIVYLHFAARHFLEPGERLHPGNAPATAPEFLESVRTLRHEGAKVVLHVHDRVPHVWLGAAETWDQRMEPLHRMVDGVVHMTQASLDMHRETLLGELPSVVVPFPSFELVPRPAASRSSGVLPRLVLIGRMVPRKHFVAACTELLTNSDLRAVVGGEPAVDRIAADLRSLAALYPERLEVLAHRLADQEITGLFSQPSVALLNQPSLLNSGVMMTALCHGAPVIAPDTPVNREHRERFGAEWIRLFQAPLQGAELQRLAEMSLPHGFPDLSANDPTLTAAAIGGFMSEIPRR